MKKLKKQLRKEIALTNIVSHVMSVVTTNSQHPKFKPNEGFWICPNCHHQSAKNSNFCPVCQNFKNGAKETVRPRRDQFKY